MYRQYNSQSFLALKIRKQNNSHQKSQTDLRERKSPTKKVSPSKITKNTTEDRQARAYLTSSLHQVYHAVLLVRRAQPRGRAIKSKRTPRITARVITAERHHLYHDRRGVLRAQRWSISWVTKTRHIGAPLVTASQTLEHVYGVRCVWFTSPGIVHLTRGCVASGRGKENVCTLSFSLSPSLRPFAPVCAPLCPSLSVIHSEELNACAVTATHTKFDARH